MDWNLYDKVNYDNGPITTSGDEYDQGLFWVDFQNWFKIPTTFVRNINFKYLAPISSTYNENRRTKAELNTFNVMKTHWGIEIRWQIIWTDRANLIENISHFKYKVRNNMRIIIKDWGIERVAKVFVENIEFDENHYNITFMNFIVTLTFRDYLAINENEQLQYSWVTDATKNISFENIWLETDFICVLTCTAWTSLNFTFTLNWVDLTFSWISSWDIVTIDTWEIDVLKNWNSIVFWGILCKLEEWVNNISIVRTWASGTYNLNLFYKKTIS